MKSSQAVLVMLAFTLVFSPSLAAEEEQETDNPSAGVPVSMLFYRLWPNLLGSLTCDYGAWYAGAAFSTWFMVESGADWGWRKIPYQHQTLAKAAISAEIAGYTVPVCFPVAAYIAGWMRKDDTLQLAALASLQAVGVVELYHVFLKLATGRRAPGITSGITDKKSDEASDFSGDFSFFTGKRGFIDGWPSGHTAAVVAMSVSFSHIYRDAPYLKAALYTFSGLVALGMSFNSHWASDVVAGVLMGYAAGKTAGLAFDVLRPDAPAASVSVRPYLLPATDGISMGLRIKM